MVLFSMFGTIMFISKVILAVLPNIHLLAFFTMSFTVVYRKKAIVPIFVYILLEGISQGFSVWWIQNIYIWPLLFLITLLVSRNLTKKKAMIVLPVICSLHGFLFGVLCSPVQFIFFSFDIKSTVSWIIAGFPFDLIHGISNLILGFFIYPFTLLLYKLNNLTQKN